MVDTVDMTTDQVQVRGGGGGEYITVADARAALGLRVWRMSKLIEETKTPTYRLGVDRRVKWLKRADVEQLRQVLYQPVAVAQAEANA